MDGSKPAVSSSPARATISEEKKGGDQQKPKSSEDKLSALKNYRRAKGLCFKCGEKWNSSHTCSAVSVHVTKEVWKILSEEHPSHPS